MASNFPDTSQINEDTGFIWVEGDIWIDPESGVSYIFEPIADVPSWRTEYKSIYNDDQRYVEVEGDNMTGDLTLGTDKITLDVSEGKVISEGDASGGANDGSVLHGASGVSVSYFNAGSKIFKGYITGNSTPTFSVSAGGEIDAAGIGYFGPVDINRTDASGCEVRADGLVRAQRAASSSSAVFQGWRGTLATTTITADGSITLYRGGSFAQGYSGFAASGTCYVSRSNDNDVTFESGKNGETSSITMTAGGSITASGTLNNQGYIYTNSGLQVSNSGGTASVGGSAAYGLSINGTSGCVIGWDGSITAANDKFRVKSSGQTEIGNDISTASGTKIYNNGALYLRSDTASGDAAAFKIYRNGLTDATNTFLITTAGDIEKCSSITAAGIGYFGPVDINRTDVHGCEVRADGLIRAQRAAGSSSAVFQGWRGGLVTTTIDANGNITAAGKITSASTEVNGTLEIGNFTHDSTITAGVNIYASGEVYSQVPTDAGARDCLRIHHGDKITTYIKGNGEAAFAGGVALDRDDVDGVQIDSDGGFKIQRTSSSNAAIQAYLKSNETARLQADGHLWLGGNIVGDISQIDLDGSDGSAHFAGGVALDRNDVDGMKIDSNGGVVIQRTSASNAAIQSYLGATETLRLSSSGQIDIGGTFPNDTNISLNPDGSAEFSGEIRTENADGGSVSLNPVGAIGIRYPYEPSSSKLLTIDSGTSLEETIALFGNGSAEFKGPVSVTRTSDSQSCFEGYKAGSSATTSKILADGSAEFAGKIEVNQDAGIWIGSGDHDVLNGDNGSNLYSGLLAMQRADDSSAIIVKQEDKSVAGFAVLANGAVTSTNQFRILNPSQSYNESISIEQNGDINTIGTICTDSFLKVGTESTKGNTLLKGHYTENDVLNTIGTHYGSSATAIGYAVEPIPGSVGYKSSAGNAAFPKSVLEVGGQLVFKAAPPLQLAIGQQVTTLEDNMVVSNTGDMTVKGSISANGPVSSTRTSDTQSCFEGYKSGTTGTTSKITADGSAKFGDGVTGSVEINPVGAMAVKYPYAPSSSKLFTISSGTTLSETIALFGNGSAYFKTRVTAGSDAAAGNPYGIDAYNNSSNLAHAAVYARNFNNSGNAIAVSNGSSIVWSVSANGAASARGLTIQLEPDDGNNYNRTTDEDGVETGVYNGPVLDVKDRLMKADSALKTLKTAATSASDFTTLKEAILTALADI